MSFRPTVFSYNATVLLIQPNPTHGWTQPMSISVLHYTADGSFDGLIEYCDERVCLSVCET